MKLSAATVILAIAANSLASAADIKVGTITVSHPWVKLAPPSAPVLGGYVSLTNAGDTPDALVQANTPAADRIEIHESRMESGVAKMRKLSGGVTIPPGATFDLKPGAVHLMLIGPKRAAQEGERIPITLEFEKAGKLDVEFQVQKLMPEADGMEGHQMR